MAIGSASRSCGRQEIPRVARSRHPCHLERESRAHKQSVSLPHKCQIRISARVVGWDLSPHRMHGKIARDIEFRMRDLLIDAGELEHGVGSVCRLVAGPVRMPAEGLYRVEQSEERSARAGITPR
jgi:hypothetical protein